MRLSVELNQQQAEFLSEVHDRLRIPKAVLVRLLLVWLEDCQLAAANGFKVFTDWVGTVDKRRVSP